MKNRKLLWAGAIVLIVLATGWAIVKIAGRIKCEVTAVRAVADDLAALSAENKQWAQQDGRETYYEYYLKSAGAVNYDDGEPSLPFTVLVLERRLKDGSILRCETQDQRNFGFIFIYRNGRWCAKFLG